MHYLVYWTWFIQGNTKNRNRHIISKARLALPMKSFTVWSKSKKVLQFVLNEKCYSGCSRWNCGTFFDRCWRLQLCPTLRHRLDIPWQFQLQQNPTDRNIIFVVVSSMYVHPSEKTSFTGGLFQMQTLPEVQRTQGIESKTWVISSYEYRFISPKMIFSCPPPPPSIKVLSKEKVNLGGVRCI